jgi:multidrug efflux pump subunit AcrB
VDDIDSVVNDITDAVNRVSLPSDVRDKPSVRQFKPNQRAILDVAFAFKDKEILDKKSRIELQQYALALEHQLLGLPEINSINRSGYLKQEIQIRAIPEMLKKYNISMNTIISAVKAGHVREPAGTIEDKDESRVTLLSELDEVEKFKKLIIRGGFEGQEIRLEKLANIPIYF